MLRRIFYRKLIFRRQRIIYINIIFLICLSQNRDENDVVPKVAQAILKLPESTHIAFRYTSIMLLGELCEWIDNHPESLESVLNFLLYSLNQKNGLAAAAASALTQICTACKSRMTCHLNGLLQIAQSLDTFQISNDSSINLLKGISTIIGRLPLDQITQPLQQLCSYQLVPLRQFLHDQSYSSTERTSKYFFYFFLNFYEIPAYDIGF